MLGYEVNDEFVLLCGSLTVRWKGILGNMYAASSFFCQNKYSFIFIFLLNINTLLLYHLVEWEIPNPRKLRKGKRKNWREKRNKGERWRCVDIPSGTVHASVFSEGPSKRRFRRRRNTVRIQRCDYAKGESQIGFQTLIRVTRASASAWVGVEHCAPVFPF